MRHLLPLLAIRNILWISRPGAVCRIVSNWTMWQRLYVVTLLTQLTNEYHSWLQLTSHSKQGSNQLLSLAHIFWGETGGTDVEECSVRFISNSFGLERTWYCEWGQVDWQNITALFRFDKTISKFNYIQRTGLFGAKPLPEPMLIIFVLLKVPNLIEVFPLINATFSLIALHRKAPLKHLSK